MRVFIGAMVIGEVNCPIWGWNNSEALGLLQAHQAPYYETPLYVDVLIGHIRPIWSFQVDCIIPIDMFEKSFRSSLSLKIGQFELILKSSPIRLRSSLLITLFSVQVGNFFIIRVDYQIFVDQFKNFFPIRTIVPTIFSPLKDILGSPANLSISYRARIS